MVRLRDWRPRADWVHYREIVFRFGGVLSYHTEQFGLNLIWRVKFPGTGMLLEGDELKTIIVEASQYAEAFKAMTGKFPPTKSEDAPWR